MSKSKQFMLFMILVNLLLIYVYVSSSINFWSELNNWYDYNMQSTWTPFYVYPHRIPDMPTVMMPVPKMLNLPFITFLIIIVTNLIMLTTYFLVKNKIQKKSSKDV